MLAPRRLRPGLTVLVAVVAVVVLAGCQVQVQVDTVVHGDGSGTVTVGVGLDDAALKRAGDLDRQVRTDDLTAAGWTVTPATREDDGFTWLRASKPFADPAQGAAVLAEVTGPDGALRDVTITRDSSLTGTTTTFSGTVDLTGLATFSDPALAAALGGDPFGGTLARIEAEEGRPATDMVDLEVSVQLPGQAEPTTWNPSFDDAAPTPLTASSSETSRAFQVGVAIALVLVVAVAVGLVLFIRRAFGRRR